MKELKPGDLVLFSHARLFDRLVRWFTKSQYSHAGVIYEIREKYILVGEAWGTGFDVRRRGVKEINLCRIRRSETVLNEIAKTMDKYIGSPYDKLNIIGLILFRYLKIKLFATSAKELTCSEVSARFFYDATFKKINFETEFGKPYDYITPADLSISKQLVDV